MEELTSDKFASVTARILDDKKAQNIKILNISNISSLADYFVICSSESSVHVKALTESVREKIKSLFGRIPIGEERDARNRWNLLDYGDIAVHVLCTEEREKYALERFWSHACCMDAEEWKEKSKEYTEYRE